MKKTLAAALAAIVMAASFTGCSDNKEPVSDPNSSAGDNSSNAVLTLTASEMAERALGYNSSNWSMAMTLVDDDTLSILLPDLSADMFEDYCFYSDAIGISGHEVFVGKPKAGQEEAVKAAFEKSLNALKEQVSFYPAGQDSVAGAVSGTTSHGYEYFIIHPDGAAVAAAMVNPNAPTAGSDSGEGLTASEMAERALGHNSNNWSMAMMLVDDETLAILLPDLSADMFEDYCFYSDAIGINGHEVFVGKPKAGQEDAVKAAFEKSLNALKEQVSFYPAGQASVAGSVSGTTDNGYEYFIIHPDGAGAAAAMVDPNAPVVDFGNGDGGEDEFGLDLPYNGAGDMARNALAANPESWTADMVAATDEELPKILKNGLRADMFEEYCLVFDVFGDCGQTVFAGKPKAGQEDAAKTALENAFNERKAEVAMFPNGAASSENAVFGISSDGYIYFVLHADGMAVADAMTASVF